MESRRAGGRRELGSYLSQLVPLVAQRHSTHHPTSFRKPFMEASGSFRNSGKLSTCYKLPARLPETFRDLPELQRKEQSQNKLPASFRKPSGTFRNCNENENDWTSFRQRFRKPSGTFRNTGNSNFYLLKPTSTTQLVPNMFDTSYHFAWHGGL